ncbi:transcriptional regulator [Streptomyces sp. MS19]|uniref:transcriptional regulator n=1 Tax=Streptomyces sp. MS19 TaxID=3385972 RepID=UPI0039A0E23A
MSGTRRPNEALACWLTQAGISNSALAREVNRRAQAAGIRGVRTTEGRVRAWRAGEVPTPPMPQLIAEFLSDRTGVLLTSADLAFPDRRAPVVTGPAMAWQPAPTVAAIDHLTRSEMMVPHSRDSDDARDVHTGDDLLVPLHQWATATPSALAARGGRIGATDVEGIRAVTTVFRDADNRHGGVLSRRAVVAQMADANDLLKTASYRDEDTARALFAAVADLGSVAGWMTFDAGKHRSAQRLFITALHAASEAGDRALGAHILQCMARQMSHLGHYREALDLVSLAEYGARHEATPATRAMLAALRARFHAILGQIPESERAAGTARQLFTTVDPAVEPPHMAFFDEAELCATLGVVHQIAVKHDHGPSRRVRAQSSLELLNRARGLRPEHRVRSAAFDAIGLARTHLAIGDVDAALAQTHRALGVFRSIGSPRVGDSLSDLHQEAAPYGTSRAGTELRELLAEALTP